MSTTVLARLFPEPAAAAADLRGLADEAYGAGATAPVLPNRPDLWRGRRSHAVLPATASGHAALDQLLPAHGWPLGSLVEILHGADGVGELSLLLPALVALTQPQRPVLWVAPPYAPHAPALARHGLDLAGLCIVQSEARQAAWVAEQALRAGCCAAVLLWPSQIDGTGLRRLQLAAETGRCHGFVFRDSRQAIQPSPAAVRLAVRRDGDCLCLRVVKCRGLLAPPAGEVVLRPVRTAQNSTAIDLDSTATAATGSVVALHRRPPR